MRATVGLSLVLSSGDWGNSLVLEFPRALKWVASA